VLGSRYGIGARFYPLLGVVAWIIPVTRSCLPSTQQAVLGKIRDNRVHCVAGVIGTHRDEGDIEFSVDFVGEEDSHGDVEISVGNVDLQTVVSNGPHTLWIDVDEGDVVILARQSAADVPTDGPRPHDNVYDFPFPRVVIMQS
jgi:hypothetical protein